MRLDITKLCAEAVVHIPHEPECNTHFGLACTCDFRVERMAQGLAALLRSVAIRRDRIRHLPTEEIVRILLTKFRQASGGDVKIRIRFSGKEK